ncbi:MAG: protein kinase [Deltaproteobacteria bacterium]|nr:protein kinase [Deltaproteobacteria bacterium]MDQ3295197.1 protein kinase [Myxococcota bacterium]
MPSTTTSLDPVVERDDRPYRVIRELVANSTSELSLISPSGNGADLVVVKRLPRALATDAAHVERFRAEARIAARLEHPSIVRVHELVESDLDDYYTMEYVRGADLRQLIDVLALKRRTVSLDGALLIGIEICSALDYAHHLTDNRGVPQPVLHRELTASKVLLGNDGTIKLTSFGAPTPAHYGKPARTDAPGYLCPERALGESLDARSDLFAVGMLLYELTSGSRLFGSDATDPQIMTRIMRGDVPRPSELRRGYPRELEAILLRALQRDRDDRYQTAGDLLADLETFLWSRWPTASPATLGATVTQAFSMGADTAPRSVLAHGSVELERIDVTPPVAPPMWHGPVPLARPFPRSQVATGTLPPPNTVVDRILPLAAPTAPTAPTVDPQYVPDDNARTTVRQPPLKGAALARAIARPNGMITPPRAPTPPPRVPAPPPATTASIREYVTIDIDLDFDLEDASEDVYATPPPSDPRDSIMRRLPVAVAAKQPVLPPPAARNAEAAPRFVEVRNSQFRLIDVVRTRIRQRLPLPRGLPRMPVALAVAVTLGVLLSAWVIWRNVHEPADLPPVITAHPAPPTEVVMKTTKRAALTVPTAAPRAAEAPGRSRPARHAPARKQSVAPVEPSTRPNVANVETVATEVIATEPAKPRLKPPHPGLFPPTDPPAATRFEATATIASLVVKGPLADAVVRRGVERTLGALRACYRTSARTRQTSPTIEMQIGFEIDQTRAATKVRAIGGGPLDALAQCAASATAEIRTQQAPASGTARISMTIRFKPET